MSGAKFVIPMLAADVAMMIETSHDIDYKSAAQLRKEAAEEERQARLTDTRNVCLIEMRDAYVMLQERSVLEPAQVARLRAECDGVHSAPESLIERPLNGWIFENYPDLADWAGKTLALGLTPEARLEVQDV